MTTHLFVFPLGTFYVFWLAGTETERWPLELQASNPGSGAGLHASNGLAVSTMLTCGKYHPVPPVLPRFTI